MKENVYIFDLDNTLYQKHNGKIINTINPTLFDKLNGKKILLSNARFYYCIKIIKMLNITNKFSSIITPDLLENIYKPNPLIYIKLLELCGISSASHNIYFFDDTPSNLIYPKNKLDWKIILINPNKEITLSNDASINNRLTMILHNILDYRFNNINDAISYLIN